MIEIIDSPIWGVLTAMWIAYVIVNAITGLFKLLYNPGYDTSVWTRESGLRVEVIGTGDAFYVARTTNPKVFACVTTFGAGWEWAAYTEKDTIVGVAATRNEAMAIALASILH